MPTSKGWENAEKWKDWTGKSHGIIISKVPLLNLWLLECGLLSPKICVLGKQGQLSPPYVAPGLVPPERKAKNSEER